MRRGASCHRSRSSFATEPARQLLTPPRPDRIVRDTGSFDRRPSERDRQLVILSATTRNRSVHGRSQREGSIIEDALPPVVPGDEKKENQRISRDLLWFSLFVSGSLEL
jgi:hypothetical protein